VSFAAGPGVTRLGRLRGAVSGQTIAWCSLAIESCRTPTCPAPIIIERGRERSRKNAGFLVFDAAPGTAHTAHFARAESQGHAMQMEEANVLRHEEFSGGYRLLVLSAPGIAPQVQRGSLCIFACRISTPRSCGVPLACTGRIWTRCRFSIRRSATARAFWPPRPWASLSA